MPRRCHPLCVQVAGGLGCRDRAVQRTWGGKQTPSGTKPVPHVGTGLMSKGGAQCLLPGQVPAVHLVPSVRGSHHSTPSQSRVTEGGGPLCLCVTEGTALLMPRARAGDLSTWLRSGSHPKDLTGKPTGRRG